MTVKFYAKQFVVLLFVLVGIAFSAVEISAKPATQEGPKSAAPLDYEYFKARIEPIFLKDRPGHARCYSCHGTGIGPQYLEPLAPGAKSWTEEQSRKIFENVSKLVNQDDVMKSKLLLRPLSPLGGGELQVEHSGGRQFESKQDPDWQAMFKWASGGK